ncbi:MAG TPA: class I SAM-dependent methyltransferase [Chitinophagaceae bacterium]|nr:class I SAM-dependent methyltransferase [Chitinophagaceae bacterium]
MQTTSIFYHPSSYRDPSGFVFEQDNILYRQVNKVFKDHFEHFINSGCYDHLQKNKLLIRHEVIEENITGSPDYYLTLKPEKIDFISYPYEWSFETLKDAALLTLQLIKECMPFGIMIKDATPYNIQWHKGRLTFIDTLSFEKYDPSQPWIAYRQFCECFLSPLLLMHYTGRPLQSLLLAYPDGIPLSITKSLLPWRSRLSFYTYLHIHLHATIASKNKKNELPQKTIFSEKKLQNLVDSLQSLIQSRQLKEKPTTWGNYYDEANERSDYIAQKKNIVSAWITELQETKTAVDLGANEGVFSYLLAHKNISVIATDFDHAAIHKLYNKIIAEDQKNIFPLLIDLANPSPAIGFNNKERISFVERTKVDLALALALVHHLAIGKNIPFTKIVELFEKLTTYLIVEFIPKQDEKVQFMLKQKKDIYDDYNEKEFVAAFDRSFFIVKKQLIANSGRSLYLMKKYDA